jgi:outer membrane protein assembly factor BamB
MWHQAFVILYFGLLSAVGGDGVSTASVQEWSGWGANYYNNRWASDNTAVSSSSITSLAPYCQLPDTIGISATPVVSGDAVFFPTWNGSFVALDYITCQVLWRINVTDIISGYAPITELQRNYSIPVSRTSPQLDNEVLYFGTITHALVIAVNRFTGRTLGITQINPHPLASVTMSPTLYNGILFVGASSTEEVPDAVPGYTCCSFVGNFLATTFHSSNGKFEVLWNVPMIPKIEAARGWSGAPVWGSQPSIDPSRGQVFIATGNTYSIPEAIVECQDATKNITAVEEGLVPDPCLPRDIWQEAVLAIDIKFGIVNWVHQLSALDAYSEACNTGNTAQCPEKVGPGVDVDL